MFNKKVIMSLLLVVMIISTCMTGIVFADDEDTADEDAVPYYEDLQPDTTNDGSGAYDYTKEINMLATLGILDSSFPKSENITKGQLAMQVIKALNINFNLKNIESKQVFSDVDPGSDVSAAILACYDLGIMHGNGDGTFGPNDPVTYEQAIKVVVSMLGYGLTASSSKDYLNIAAGNQILKGIKKGLSETVGGNIIAKLIYNSLEVKTIQLTSKGVLSEYSTKNGDTLLTRHDIKKIRDIVNATPITSLTGASTLKDNKVRIGTIVCDVNGIDVISYLGYEVDAYIRTFDYNTKDPIILYVEPTSKNEAITINDEQWIGIQKNGNSSKTISYYTDKDDSTAVVTKDADVIYQNVANPYYDITKFVPNNSELTLLDNNGDGDYEVVFIRNFKTYVVLDKGNTTKKLNCDKGTVTLDPASSKYTFKIIKNNTEINFDGIGVDNVLSVTEGKALNGFIYEEVIVSDKKLIGAVSETYKESDSNFIKVGINAAKVLDTAGRTFSVGDEGNFLLDFRGSVAAFRSIAGSKVFGYVMGVKSNKGVDSSASLKILRQDGSIGEYSTKPFIQFDENRVSCNTIKPEGENYSKINREMIMYKTNSQGIISDIISKENPAQDADTGLSLYQEDGITRDIPSNPPVVSFGTTLIRRQFNSNVPLLFIGSNAEINPYPISGRDIKVGDYVGKDRTIGLDPSVLVFVVPLDENNAADKDYKVTNSSYFNNDGRYYTEVFNYDENTYTSPLILVRNDSTPSVTSGANPVMVKDVTTCVDDETGEIYYHVDLMDKSGENSYRVSEDLLSRTAKYSDKNLNDLSPFYLNPGDLIKIALADDEITIMESVVQADNIIPTTENVNYFSEHIMTTGKIVKINGNIVTMKYQDGDQIRMYNTAPVPKICIYDPSGKGSFFIGSISDLEPGDIISLRSSEGYVTSIFGYIQN